MVLFLLSSAEGSFVRVGVSRCGSGLRSGAGRVKGAPKGTRGCGQGARPRLGLGGSTRANRQLGLGFARIRARFLF